MGSPNRSVSHSGVPANDAHCETAEKQLTPKLLCLPDQLLDQSKGLAGR